MPQTLEQTATTATITIPAPKFAIGQPVIDKEHGQGVVIGWMYAPADPGSDEFPVYDAGFAYFCQFRVYHKQIGRHYTINSTLHESSLSAAA